MGITEEDLKQSQLVETKLVSYRRSRSLDAHIFEVEFEDKLHRFGAIGEEACRSVLAHGRKDDLGNVYLTVPRHALKPEGAGWVNEAY